MAAGCCEWYSAGLCVSVVFSPFFGRQRFANGIAVMTESPSQTLHVPIVDNNVEYP
jgi:hypothetical protein